MSRFDSGRFDSGGGSSTDLSGVTAGAGDVLAGKIIVSALGAEVEGTLPDNADADVEVTTVAGTTIPAGKYDGTGKAILSAAEAAKVIAGNIKDGVTLLGVEGSHAGGANYAPVVSIKLDVVDIATSAVESTQTISGNFVRNYYNLLASQGLFLTNASGGGSFGAGKLPLKGVDAAAKYDNSSAVALSYMLDNTQMAGTDDSYNPGIRVGTGDTTWSFDDYDLAATMAKGTGAGQMTYDADSAPSFAYDSGTKKYTATRIRDFRNLSGGSITVKEVGFYSSVIYKPSTSYYFLLDRTVLTSPIAVADDKKITVTYTFEMTFPA